MPVLAGPLLSQHRTLIELFLIFLYAVALRMGYLALAGGLDESLHDSMGDQEIYLDLARNLANGLGMTTSSDVWVATAYQPTSIVPPLYPLFLAGSFRLFGESILVVRLIQVVSLSTIPIFVYFLARRLTAHSSALAASIVCATYPAFVMYSRPLMAESLFFPAVVALTLLTYKLTETSGALLSLCWSATAGLAVATRTECIFLVIAFLVYFGFRAVHHALPSRLTILLCLAVFVAALVPCGYYNYVSHGTFSVVPNKRWSLWDQTSLVSMRKQQEWSNVTQPERLVVARWLEKTEIERDAELGRLAREFVLQHPIETLIERAKSLIRAYPIVPLEWFRSRSRPDGWQFGETSIDDVVRYSTTSELVRVWCFRVAFASALCGFVVCVRRRDVAMIPLLIVVTWNIAHTAALVGRERQRLQVDPILITMAFAAVPSGFRREREGSDLP